MSNVHVATIASLNSQIEEANQQVNALLVSGDAAGVTKARRKIANLTLDREAAQKLAHESYEKAVTAASVEIAQDTREIAAGAIGEVNEILSRHSVSDLLPKDDDRFYGCAREIALANNAITSASDAFYAAEQKATRVGDALTAAVARHSALKANRTNGDAAGAADLYAASLDVESLTALHAEAAQKCDAVDVATPSAAVAHAKAALTAAKNQVVREALYSHTQKTEAAFVASLRSLVGFVRGAGSTPIERTVKVFSVYQIGADLDWLNRTGALRA